MLGFKPQPLLLPNENSTIRTQKLFRLKKGTIDLYLGWIRSMVNPFLSYLKTSYKLTGSSLLLPSLNMKNANLTKCSNCYHFIPLFIKQSNAVV